MKKQPLKKRKKNLIQKIFDLRYFFYDFVKLTGAIPALIYFRVKRYYKSGKKPKGQFRGTYIVASNHSTFLDPIILLIAFWKRRVSFIATEDLFDTKLKRFFFNSVRMIPINKQNFKMETFKVAKDVIDSGHLVMIFPEGHVQLSGEIDEYKSGAVMLGLLTKSPIMQVYIKQREKWWHRQKVIIGEKVYLEDYLDSKIPTMEDINKITKILKKQEEELAEILEKK